MGDRAEQGVGSEYLIPDELWERMRLLLPPPRLRPRNRGGPPRADDRKVANAIFYVLRTGCQWKALPRCPGVPSAAHARFQEWQAAGAFSALWREGLLSDDEVKSLDWTWQPMDGAVTKALLGGKATGPNPTDRAKRGTKRSVLVATRKGWWVSSIEDEIVQEALREILEVLYEPLFRDFSYGFRQGAQCA
ncbi:MAG TPA: IS5 family transposase [Anaeromyxobacteraceae bacterium]|nr:IS5 family transposase [Anaeromyxobacteraceae bacterium]